MKPILSESTERLTLTCFHARHPHICQSCGAKLEPSRRQERNLTRWQEHDHHDKPEHRVVVLCKTCENRLIEKHPRLYRALQDNEPFAGCMDICLDCKYRDGVACRHVDAKANGGQGVLLIVNKPGHGFACGPSHGCQPLVIWVEQPMGCQQKVDVSQTAALTSGASEISNPEI